MGKAVRTQHTLTLEDGSSFLTEGHQVSENRYFDGDDYLYFETYNLHQPIGGTFYHKWKMATSKILYAYVIPMRLVKSLTKYVPSTGNE